MTFAVRVARTARASTIAAQVACRITGALTVLGAPAALPTLTRRAVGMSGAVAVTRAGTTRAVLANVTFGVTRAVTVTGARHALTGPTNSSPAVAVVLTSTTDAP